MVYFIGDLHFNDSGIIKYENRPFNTIDEMNNTLIRNWNSTVSDTDTVFVLGDVSLIPSTEELKTIIDKLHGEKHLILGNHDKKLSPASWRKLGFNMVYDYPILYEGFLILSHEPLYINENTPYINIFAHVHGNPIYRTITKNSYCVSVERIKYTPINVEIIKNEISKERNK